jgi:hypothetical protein
MNPKLDSENEAHRDAARICSNLLKKHLPEAIKEAMAFPISQGNLSLSMEEMDRLKETVLIAHALQDFAAGRCLIKISYPTIQEQILEILQRERGVGIGTFWSSLNENKDTIKTTLAEMEEKGTIASQWVVTENETRWFLPKPRP